jgi:hypothetical protein
LVLAVMCATIQVQTFSGSFDPPENAGRRAEHTRAAPPRAGDSGSSDAGLSRLSDLFRDPRAARCQRVSRFCLSSRISADSAWRCGPRLIPRPTERSPPRRARTARRVAGRGEVMQSSIYLAAFQRRMRRPLL